MVEVINHQFDQLDCLHLFLWSMNSPQIKEKWIILIIMKCIYNDYLHTLPLEFFFTLYVTIGWSLWIKLGFFISFDEWVLCNLCCVIHMWNGHYLQVLGCFLFKIRNIGFMLFAYAPMHKLTSNIIHRINLEEHSW